MQVGEKTKPCLNFPLLASLCFRKQLNKYLFCCFVLGEDHEKVHQT